MEIKRINYVPQPNNVKDIIYRSADKFADCTAFTIKHQEDKEISYEELKNIPSLRGDGKFGSSKK